MSAIGGYFELELRRGQVYHSEAVALNSARHCLEYILRVRGYRKVYIPYYTCNVVLEPIQRLGIEVARYKIDAKLNPFRCPDLDDGEAFLYTNYFGLKQRAVEELAEKYGSRLIVDNAQAFYAPALPGIDTFYSPRKFFGVPDGGYMYTEMVNLTISEQDKSYHRMSHLLMRIDCGPEKGYESFRQNSHTLIDAPILRMSRLTNRILSTIDYERAREIRLENFSYLHERLKGENSFSFAEYKSSAPMVYPYRSTDCSLRQKLINNKVFVAKYWPGVADIPHCPELEKDLVENLIPLPIDQRYSQIDMERIVDLITK